MIWITSCNSKNNKTVSSVKGSEIEMAGKPAKVIPPVSSELCDLQANDNTKKVMEYFVEKVYGKKILTGIMDCAWSSTIDMNSKVLNDTGYEPALMGYDFIFSTKSDSKNWYSPSQTEKAINWWLNGGLVTFTWHWLDPFASSGNGASYKPEEIKFRIPYNEATDSLNTKSKELINNII